MSKESRPWKSSADERVKAVPPTKLEQCRLLCDVLEGVVEPVVEGDVALAVLVDGLEVLLALGDTSLEELRHKF